MPDDLIGSLDTQSTGAFFTENFIAVVALGVGLVALYVFAERIVRATLPRVLDTKRGEFEDDGVAATELEKRTETLSALATTLTRLTALSGILLIIIGIFELWSLLTVAALFLAAVTLAGQSIVLDYLMGLFIVIEGTFFKGDNIEFSQMKGDVEDVGLRRTVIRGPDGTVHSISNGELRVVSNRTRIFAAAEVKVSGIREEDLERVIEIGDRVGDEIKADPTFASDILVPHALAFMEDNDELGSQAIFRGRVVAARRWAVSTEMRRRLNQEFLEAGVELNKRGIVPRVPRHDGDGRAVRADTDSGRMLDD